MCDDNNHASEAQWQDHCPSVALCHSHLSSDSIIPCKGYCPISNPTYTEVGYYGETCFQWWQTSLKLPLWFLYCKRIQLNTGDLAFSALKKTLAIRGYYEFLSTFCQFWRAFGSLSRIRYRVWAEIKWCGSRREGPPDTRAKEKWPQLLVIGSFGSVYCLKSPDVQSADGFLPYFAKGKLLNLLSIY